MFSEVINVNVRREQMVILTVLDVLDQQDVRLTNTVLKTPFVTDRQEFVSMPVSQQYVVQILIVFLSNMSPNVSVSPASLEIPTI
jgi:hypothetical protein